MNFLNWNILALKIKGGAGKNLKRGALRFKQVFKYLRSKTKKIWVTNTKFWPNSSYVFLQGIYLQSTWNFWPRAISSFSKKQLVSNKKILSHEPYMQKWPGSSLSPWADSLDKNACQNNFFKVRGGSGVQKTSLAYIKVQPVMESLLFRESESFL